MLKRILLTRSLRLLEINSIFPRNHEIFYISVSKIFIDCGDEIKLLRRYLKTWEVDKLFRKVKANPFILGQKTGNWQHVVK